MKYHISSEVFKKKNTATEYITSTLAKHNHSVVRSQNTSKNPSVTADFHIFDSLN